MKIIFNEMVFPHTRLYADGNINPFEVLHDPVEISYTAIFNSNELQGSYKIDYHEYQSMNAIEIKELLEDELVKMVSEEELKPPDAQSEWLKSGWYPVINYDVSDVDLSKIGKIGIDIHHKQPTITVKDKLLGIVTSIPNPFYKKRKR